MNWKQIVLIAFLGISLLIYIFRVGKLREPISPSDAVWGTIEIAFLIWLVATI